MQAILEFELPDEERDFRDAVDGTDASAALRELSELLRSRIKYGIPDTVKTPDDAYEEIRAEFFQILDAHLLTLDR